MRLANISVCLKTQQVPCPYRAEQTTRYTGGADCIQTFKRSK